MKLGSERTLGTHTFDFEATVPARFREAALVVYPSLAQVVRAASRRFATDANASARAFTLEMLPSQPTRSTEGRSAGVQNGNRRYIKGLVESRAG